MDKLSILLGLSGSEQSKYASEVAWSIAQNKNVKLTAEHVIDTKTVWELLRNDKPGFIGSGPYIAAYEGLRESMNSLATKLLEKYDSLARARNVDSTSVANEGSPVQLLSTNANNHNLVVIGHQPRPKPEDQDRERFIRYAVAEGLAHECPRPLLIVQKEVERWNSLTIMVSFDHLNFDFIDACISFANLLSLKPKLVAIGSGTNEASKESFLRDLKEARPALNDMDIEVHTISGMAADDLNGILHPDDVDLKWTPDFDTLMVIPTRESSGARLTLFDTSPSSFVENLVLPAILLWPEEYTSLKFDELATANNMQRA